MEIVGNGFIARNLAAVGERHPHATVLAAGVSSTSVLDGAEFDREAALVDEVTRRCRADGRLVVFLSSASHALYGTGTTAMAEGTELLPTSPYGRQKLRLERVVAESGAPWLVLRVSHAMGRWQRPHQLLPAFVQQVRSGSVRLYQGAHRDLIDAADLTRAVDGLLEQGVENEVVNVASGRPLPIQTVIHGIEERLGLSARHEIVDGPQAMTHVSVDKLCELLPEMRSVTDADYLDRMLDRYLPYY
ncbi:NAD-dependent epimerase/dehydratase family protein [Streptomyces sp. NRRL F-5650]|uniref:NAD-dependent epimerase/dehydratase family protein n=1 Tax=Streptomyces sp. NRRL F-5650 TaxID=1463868 RepID=UPI0004C95EB5|nr:NAD-dependent epimerase/dehydratase family protein [Streptomyces sp. NRRL F-5650]